MLSKYQSLRGNTARAFKLDLAVRIGVGMSKNGSHSSNVRVEEWIGVCQTIGRRNECTGWGCGCRGEGNFPAREPYA